MEYREMTIRVPLVQESDANAPKPSNAAEVAALCQDLKGLAQECFIVITMNNKNVVINKHMVSLGSLTESLVHPRDVFRYAILDNAASIVIVHNHPSGDTTPSRADRQLTARLKECAEIMGFRMLDHVIIGNNYHSFAECGAL
jgi:DNA repair protein RadC